MASVSSKDEADMRARTGRELRRKSQKTIFDARQRLTSSSGTRASFDFELLDEHAGSRLSGVLAMPVLLIILGLFSSLWVPPAAAAVWVVLALTSNSMVILVCRRFKQTATAEKFNAGQWTASFVAVETVFGICWSLLSLFSLVARSENLSVAMFAMVLVGIAGNAVSTRTLPPATLVSTLPASLTVSANLVFTGGQSLVASRGQLDASVSYNINARFSVSLDAYNLTDAQRIQYQTTKYIPREADYDGRTFTLSLHGTF